MPVVTHQKGPLRYVLSYDADVDLDTVCGAIIAMAKRPELELEADDVFALAEQVAEQATREALAARRNRDRERR